MRVARAPPRYVPRSKRIDLLFDERASRDVERVCGPGRARHTCVLEVSTCSSGTELTDLLGDEREPLCLPNERSGYSPVHVST